MDIRKLNLQEGNKEQQSMKIRLGVKINLKVLSPSNRHKTKDKVDGRVKSSRSEYEKSVQNVQ